MIARVRLLPPLVVLVAATAARAQTPETTGAAPPPAYSSTVHARPKRDDGTPTIVMTARELKERGAQSLADALDLIPELQVRQGGNGMRLDLRGAKQFSVLLLIDGVPVTEPYFGIFDISAIPVTDIVEIRVQLAPASPLEGPGGDGGIVEVFTLRARGGKLLEGRLVGSSMPEGELAATGRAPLPHDWGVRASATGRIAQPTYPVVAPDGSGAHFSDRQWNVNGALRLDRDFARGRFSADAWYGHRSFFIPPSDTTGTLLQDITGEDAFRLILGGEFERARWRVAVGAYGELLARATDSFTDYTLKNKVSHQDLLSGRIGAAVHGDRPWAARGVVGLFSARLSVDTDLASVHQSGLAGAWGASPYAELAVGGKLRWRWLTVEAAAGVLLPLDDASTTWPEGKLVVGFHPHPILNVLLIGARKGRLPTLRELYDPLQGSMNATDPSKRHLGPEQTWHAELQLQLRPNKLVAARLSGYVRRIDGLIRLDPFDMVAPHDVNLGTIDARGLETGIDVARDKIVGGGFTYIFEDAYSPGLGFNAIPNFPRHRIDAYLSSTWKRRIGGLVRLRWVAERVVQGATLPRYYVMELDVWGRIWRTLRGSLRVDNLTNNQYLLLPGLTALGTTVTVTLDGLWP